MVKSPSSPYVTTPIFLADYTAVVVSRKQALLLLVSYQMSWFAWPSMSCYLLPMIFLIGFIWWPRHVQAGFWCLLLINSLSKSSLAPTNTLLLLRKKQRSFYGNANRPQSFAEKDDRGVMRILYWDQTRSRLGEMRGQTPGNPVVQWTLSCWGAQAAPCTPRDARRKKWWQSVAIFNANGDQALPIFCKDCINLVVTNSVETPFIFTTWLANIPDER